MVAKILDNKDEELKGAMSAVAHARVDINQLEKDSPTFSSSVGGLWKLRLSVRILVILI